MSGSLRGLLALTVLATATAVAGATPLLPGESVSGTVESPYSGSITATVPFANTAFSLNGGTTVGFLSTAVVQGSSVSGGSGLDFVYQVNVVAGSVTGISLRSFRGFSTDVFQTADIADLSGTNPFTPGTVQIDTFHRGTTGPGETIDVTFASNGVAAGQRSLLAIVHTDSSTFVTTNPTVNGMGPFISLQTLAPIPEPGTLALWGGTFGGAACFMAWRRRESLPRAA
jgi:hypothetical protein